jgi:hypothetical protein
MGQEFVIVSLPAHDSIFRQAVRQAISHRLGQGLFLRPYPDEFTWPVSRGNAEEQISFVRRQYALGHQINLGYFPDKFDVNAGT